MKFLASLLLLLAAFCAVLAPLQSAVGCPTTAASSCRAEHACGGHAPAPCDRESPGTNAPCLLRCADCCLAVLPENQPPEIRPSVSSRENSSGEKGLRRNTPPPLPPPRPFA